MGEMGDEPIRDLMARAPRRKFTVSDYHRMGDAGILGADDRVELIEGELFEMAPIGCLHAAAVNCLTMRLAQMAGDHYLLSSQNPVVISDFSEPQPDLALLATRADRYRTALPRASEVMLVIEVSDATARWDRVVKMSMYSRHGIAEAWLVEIPRRIVTVYRDPGPQGYRSSTEVAQGTVSPLRMPELQLGIEEIFGPLAP
jgi:Uma2 family endonuclease